MDTQETVVRGELDEAGCRYLAGLRERLEQAGAASAEG